MNFQIFSKNPTQTPMAETNMFSPPPPPSTSDTSFPILAISILGILTTAILLVSYYVFVTKCCKNSRHRSRRQDEVFTVYLPPLATESHGLTESVIRAIPIVRFKRRTNGNCECAVCLNEFQEEERVKLLPSCSHAFHIDCIDTWLQSNPNCPICRSEITTTYPFQNGNQFMVSLHNDSVVIEMRDDGGGNGIKAQTPTREASSLHKKVRRMKHHMSFMGDECIDVRSKDEEFCVQPMRRSFSMDSSSDRQLFMAVQEVLRQQQSSLSYEECSSSGGSFTRIRRPFFSFGHGRSSRNAVLQ